MSNNNGVGDVRCPACGGELVKVLPDSADLNRWWATHGVFVGWCPHCLAVTRVIGGGDDGEGTGSARRAVEYR